MNGDPAGIASETKSGRESRPQKRDGSVGISGFSSRIAQKAAEEVEDELAAARDAEFFERVAAKCRGETKKKPSFDWSRFVWLGIILTILFAFFAVFAVKIYKKWKSVREALDEIKAAIKASKVPTVAAVATAAI